MGKVLDYILGEFEKHKGEFVIDDWGYKVQRLIAIAQDDMDIYYVFWNGRKTNWQSCVGRFIPLKGYIEDKYYNDFIRMAKLNHYDQIGKDGDEKVIEYRKQLEKEVLDEGNKGTNEYLTDICWDIN
jgi:hypothetical protein